MRRAGAFAAPQGDLHIAHSCCELQRRDAFIVSLLGQGDATELEEEKHALLLRHLDRHVHRGPTALVHFVQANAS